MVSGHVSKKKRKRKTTYLHFILLFAKWTEADLLFLPVTHKKTP